jgi:hypothetical protein
MIRNEARLSRRPFPNGKRTTIAAVNDKLSEKGDWLHPTKGFRHISDKRAKAAQFVAEIKSRVFMTAQGPTPKDYNAPYNIPHPSSREADRRMRQMRRQAK